MGVDNMSVDKKKDQAVELVGRVRERLLNSAYPELAIKAQEMVFGFLLCVEELERINARDRK
jgi:hypothetical protein